MSFSSKYQFVYRSLMLFLLFWAGESFGQIIDISEFKEATLIGDQASYFEDFSAKMTYDQVLTHKADFTKQKRKIYGSPSSKSVLWVCFEANSTSTESIWLDIHNSNILDCQFYKLDESDQLITSYRTGSLVANGERLRDVHTFWFPLIDGNDKNTYKFLIRVRTQLALELPLYVGQESDLYKNTNHDNWMAIAFLGGLLGLFIYNIFFFFSLRRRIYLFYSLNVLSFLFVIPYFNNFPITVYLFGQHFTHQYLSVWVWIPFLTSALFASQYLRLKRQAPWLHYFLMGFVMFFIILTPITLIWPSPWLARAYVFGTLIFYFSCMLIGYYMFFVKKDKKAVLFSVGWTAMFLSIIVVVLVRNGVIDHNIILRNASYIGLSIEMFVFAIAIGKFMNELRVDQVKLNKALNDSNEELVALNESLDSFNYHVSHDLKTVLNNTKALGNMAIKYNEKGDQEKLREILNKLSQVADNGVETVQSFLSLGRIDNLFDREKAETIHLRTELDRVLELHGLKGKIKLSVKNNELEYVKMHSKAFESIYLNLFTNTIKYSNENPTAEIEFFRDKKEYIFVYKDHGIGIDMDQYGDQVFKAFSRAGNVGHSEGTGVGLYVLNRIVNMYDGKAEMESELNKGIRLTIRFPEKSISTEHD